MQSSMERSCAISSLLSTSMGRLLFRYEERAWRVRFIRRIFA
jgi:hypothetical protein